MPQNTEQGPPVTSNRLALQKSPYLLQHAHNPVDWYPWGEEAFAAARDQSKPIFLSIGYATCHWCHVMERESFEDREIAALMNDLFVCIKVDREERPDVDRLYMSYVQATSGGGGWPLSVWLTPERVPLAGGTYFPPEERHGQPGFRGVCERIAAAWKSMPDRLAAGASQTLGELERALLPVASKDPLAADLSVKALSLWRRTFDEKHGGFGGAPKFPRPVVLNFLFHHAAQTEDAQPALMAIATLGAMSRGGIKDHLGGGFHRYSVDAEWHVPHFEKMLYDQAQLARSYLEAHQLTGDDAFAEEARGLFTYVLRDLTDPDTGAFFSAEDADSLVDAPGRRKAEGAYYVWTHEEVARLLGDDAPAFAAHYDVRPGGNAQDPHGELSGKNVLRITRSLEDTAEALGRAPDDLAEVLAQGRQKLFEARALRPRPLLDDKVICAWNGLMISAFAKGFQVLGDARYLSAAQRAAGFIRKTLYGADTHELKRRWRDSEAAFAGCLEDYTHLVAGLLDLYEADFDLAWLTWAEQLTQQQITLFWDDAQGGFFADSGSDPALLLRLKDDYDGAEPSGNAIAAGNLLRLAALVGREEWLARAEQTIQSVADRLTDAPHATPEMLVAHDRLRDAGVQVVLTGEKTDADFLALRKAAQSVYVPGRSLVTADAAFRERYPLSHIAAMGAADGTALAYVCRSRSCLAPAGDAHTLETQLKGFRVNLDT